MENKISDIREINRQLLSQMQQYDYGGYDPFDGLNSPIIKKSGFYHFPLVRLAWLQVHKLSPINLRPITRVPRQRNAKGIALIMLGLLEEHLSTGESLYLLEAEKLGDWLLENSCDRKRWEHYCWGYHFDWQSRAFYVPAGTPNIISTCYVARALLSLGSLTGNEKYKNAALDAAEFIERHLYIANGNSGYYGYIPGDNVLVHNASLWGAALVARAGAELDDSKMLEQSRKACRHSVNAQRDDGAWIYGEKHHHQFIDSFHTGYNLEALFLFQQWTANDEFEKAILSGMRFYKKHFFLSDGTPKYYSDNLYPLDMHCTAQGILTLLDVGGEQGDKALADKLVNWSVANMYRENRKTFLYQKRRWFRNGINYLRWTQAWSYYALARYLRVRQGEL